MKKRSGYKYHIEQALINNHWEIIEIGSRDMWREYEYWKIKTIYLPDLIVYLSFNVIPEPYYTIIVNDIIASTDYDNIIETSITALHMQGRKFNVKLDEFITDLNTFRNNIKDYHENNSRS